MKNSTAERRSLRRRAALALPVLTVAVAAMFSGSAAHAAAPTPRVSPNFIVDWCTLHPGECGGSGGVECSPDHWCG